MNKEMRKKFTVKLDLKKEMARPRPMSIGIITDNSKSDQFDEAKSEWELESAVDETAAEFTNVCELCHNPHLKCNFIIKNPNTGKRLRVGSSCIIRFGVVRGNIDFESGATIINNFVDDLHYVYEARIHLNEVLVLNPDAKAFKVFYESLKKLFELRGIAEPNLDDIGNVLYGDEWAEKSQNHFISHRLWTMWTKPGTIETVRSKVSRLPTYKEGSTWRKRSKSKVYSAVAGRSKVYDVERFVTDTKPKERGGR